MRRIHSVLAILFCLFFVSATAYSQEMPLALRPRLESIEHCVADGSIAYNGQQEITCFKYFADELELVVGDSLYKPKPYRADDLDGIRALVGSGKAQSYEFYSDELKRKLDLSPEIAKQVEENLSHIVTIRLKNVKHDQDFFNVILMLSIDDNIKEIRFLSEVKALGHTNDPSASQQYYFEREKFEEAQRLAGFCGKSIHIFHNDTGWNPHYDLPTPVGGFDYTTNTRGIPEDGFGHGTATAGVMAMIPNNSEGGVGTCPNASFWAMKVLADDGGGTWNIFNTAVIDQANICARLKTEDPFTRCIANYSIGGLGPVPSVDATLAISHAAGVVSVAGAGNTSVALERFPFYPAAAKNVIAVGAMDKKDNKAPWSAYSTSLLTTFAYGEEIFTTTIRSGPVSSPTGYAKASGTSYAAPQVTGAIGLLWSWYPYLTPQQIRFIVIGTADQFPHLKSFITSGGRLNALTMLTLDFAESPSAPSLFQMVNVSHVSITTVQRFSEPVVGFVVCASEEPFGEADLDSSNVECSFRFDPALLHNTGQLSESRLSYRKEDTDYFLRSYAINRVGNVSLLSEMLQTRTKKSEVAKVVNFTKDNGQPDQSGWSPWWGPTSRNAGDVLIPHLSNILPSPDGEPRWLWRIGRKNQLDYFTNTVTDVLIVSDVVDFKGTNGASLWIDLFQVTSPLFRYVDRLELYTIELEDNNAWGRETLVQDFSSFPNSNTFATSPYFIDLSDVSGKRFRLVFRCYYGTAGMFGGIGWMFGNLRIQTDQQQYLF